MSYERQYRGGGGHRRRYRGENKSPASVQHAYIHVCVDDYDHDRNREVVETPEQKLRTAIIRMGDVVGNSLRLCAPGP